MDPKFVITSICRSGNKINLFKKKKKKKNKKKERENNDMNLLMNK